MNRERILLVALLVVCILQSLVTLVILTVARRGEAGDTELRQQVAELGAKVDRVQFALENLPARGGGAEGGGHNKRGNKVTESDEGKAAGRLDGVITALAQIMVLEYRGDTMLSPAQLEQARLIFTQFKGGQREGIRKRILGLLNATQVQFVTEQGKLIDAKALQLRNIPNSDEGAYADMALDFLDKTLRPDDVNTGSPAPK
jgi:hypothetical protein